MAHTHKMHRPRRSTQYCIHTPEWTIFCYRNERSVLRHARREARKCGAPVKVERYVRQHGEWRTREIIVEVPHD